MKQSSPKLLQTILPFLFLGVFIVLIVIGFVVFSYVLIIGAVIGLILFLISAIREKFQKVKRMPPNLNQYDKPSKHSGRTIEHDS